MEADLFGDAADVLRSLLPDDYGAVGLRPRRYGLKVWFDAAEPGREHYEAQVIGARHAPGAQYLALEIGFHAEHPKPEANQAVLAPLVAAERRWRRALGPDAVAGPFLGRDTWARLSETWLDPDLGAPDLPEEIGTRLLDYVTAIEPLRRPGSGAAPRAGRKATGGARARTH